MVVSHEALLFVAGWLLLMSGTGLVAVVIDVTLQDKGEQ